jgi:hypothetical protein
MAMRDLDPLNRIRRARSARSMRPAARSRRASLGQACAIAALALLAPGAVMAGPHDRGVILPHLNTSIEYTSTVSSYEGQSELRDCEEAVVEGRVDEEHAQVWFVLASFHDSPGPVQLAGACFGFGDYDGSKLQFTAFGASNDGYLEIPTGRWPGPDSGTALVFKVGQEPRTTVVELYWFASYAYGAVVVPLTIQPDNPGGQFSVRLNSDGSGPDDPEDYAGAFGAMGFGTPGMNPCGDMPGVEGACCIFSDCTILTREDCEGQGGQYLGDNTDCFPNPCGKPIETTWGILKRIYQ